MCTWLLYIYIFDFMFGIMENIGVRYEGVGYSGRGKRSKSVESSRVIDLLW